MKREKKQNGLKRCAREQPKRYQESMVIRLSWGDANELHVRVSLIKIHIWWLIIYWHWCQMKLLQTLLTSDNFFPRTCLAFDRENLYQIFHLMFAELNFFFVSPRIFFLSLAFCVIHSFSDWIERAKKKYVNRYLYDFYWLLNNWTHQLG